MFAPSTRLLAAFLLPMLASAVPAMIHHTFSSKVSASSSNPLSSVQYDASASSASELASHVSSLLASQESAPDASAVFFILPPHSFNTDGLSHLASTNRLEETRAIFESPSETSSSLVKSYVDGGVSLSQLQNIFVNSEYDVEVVDDVESVQDKIGKGKIVLCDVKVSACLFLFFQHIVANFFHTLFTIFRGL